MFFEYTFRDSKGSKAVDVIEASDRSSAFSQLKGRGISVISMKEVSGPRKAQSGIQVGGATSSKAVVRGVIAALLVIGGAILVWSLLSSGSSTDAPDLSKNTPKKVAADKKNVAAAKKEQVPQQTQRPQSAPIPKAVPLPAAPITTNETLVVSNNVVSLPTNELSSVHRNSTEQLLMWVFMTPLGNMPPPLPKLPKCDEKRMWEILTSPIPMKEGDTARQQDAKQTIELAKKELKDYLKKGGDINEFFNYYHGQLKLAHMQYQESQRSVLKVCREEDPEVAREYIEKVNSDLDAKGIKHVVIPPKFKQKLGLE